MSKQRPSLEMAQSQHGPKHLSALPSQILCCLYLHSAVISMSRFGWVAWIYIVEAVIIVGIFFSCLLQSHHLIFYEDIEKLMKKDFLRCLSLIIIPWDRTLRSCQRMNFVRMTSLAFTDGRMVFFHVSDNSSNIHVLCVENCRGLLLWNAWGWLFFFFEWHFLFD